MYVRFFFSFFFLFIGFRTKVLYVWKFSNPVFKWKIQGSNFNIDIVQQLLICFILVEMLVFGGNWVDVQGKIFRGFRWNSEWCVEHVYWDDYMDFVHTGWYQIMIVICHSMNSSEFGLGYISFGWNEVWLGWILLFTFMSHLYSCLDCITIRNCIFWRERERERSLF